MPTPYARVLTSLAGGAPTAGARTVAGGQSVQLSLENFDRVQTVLWEIMAGPPDWAPPAPWVSNGGRGYFLTTTGSALPAAFTLPNSPVWGKFLFRATVNDGRSAAGKLDRTLVDRTAALAILGPHGELDVAPFEDVQFGASGGWADQLQRTLRVLAANVGTGSGGSGPALASSVPPAGSEYGSAGSSTAAARADHSHPTAVLSVTGTGGISATTTHGVVTVDGSGISAGGGATPSDAPPRAPTATASAGTSTAFARGDHAHPATHTVNGLLGDITIAGRNGTVVDLFTATNTINVGPTQAPPTGTGIPHYVDSVRQSAVGPITNSDIVDGSLAPSKITPSDTDTYVFTTVSGVAGWFPPASGGGGGGGAVALPSGSGVVHGAGGSATSVGPVTNSDINDGALALTKLAPGTGADGQVVTKVAGVLAMASLPAGLVIPAGPGVVKKDSGGTLSVSAVVDSDIAANANLAITKIVKAPFDGQTIVTANQTQTFAPPNTIERVVVDLAGKAGTTVSPQLFQAPAATPTGGAKYVITGVYCILSEAITASGGANTVAISAGAPGGTGTEYMKSLSLSPSTGNLQRMYGLSIANEMGSYFTSPTAIDRGYNVDFDPGGTISASHVVAANVTGGKMVWFVCGFAAS